MPAGHIVLVFCIKRFIDKIDAAFPISSTENSQINVPVLEMPHQFYDNLIYKIINMDHRLREH